MDDDSADGDDGRRHFRIIRTLAPGRYFVRVEGGGGGGADYELTVTAQDG